MQYSGDEAGAMEAQTMDRSEVLRKPPFPGKLQDNLRERAGNSLQPIRADERILDEFDRRIRSSISHAYTTLDQLTQLGDRAFGEEPQSSSTGDKLPVSPQGAVDRVFCALTDLDNMLCRLEHAGNRLHELA